jgi:hypothetical protein
LDFLSDWDLLYNSWQDVGKEIPHPALSGQSPISQGHSCEHCIKIPVGELLQSPGGRYKLCESVAQLEETAKGCDLYQMIFSSIGKSCSDTGPITVSAEPNDSHTVVGPDKRTDPTATPRLLVYLGRCDISSHCVLSDQYVGSATANVELPILPEYQSMSYILRLDAWLRECVSGHQHPQEPRGRTVRVPAWTNHPRPCPSARLPSRVLDVGHPRDLGTLCIRETRRQVVGRYIAVSHRWPEDPDRRILTTSKNIQERQKALAFQELPRTFQDAVTVARMLGVQFLWIDALCIKQDDTLDIGNELRRMEEVFTSAYCTIAATSARSWGDGFLRRSAETCVRLFDGSESSTKSVYVTRGGQNFSHDIEKAELNGRAWVLQERALSRRIIHFAAAQTYWECGLTIRCETIRQDRQ